MGEYRPVPADGVSGRGKLTVRPVRVVISREPKKSDTMTGAQTAFHIELSFYTYRF